MTNETNVKIGDRVIVIGQKRVRTVLEIQDTQLLLFCEEEGNGRYLYPKEALQFYEEPVKEVSVSSAEIPKNLCMIPGCHKTVHSKKLCSAHYQQQYRLEKEKQNQLPLQVRLDPMNPAVALEDATATSKDNLNSVKKVELSRWEKKREKMLQEARGESAPTPLERANSEPWWKNRRKVSIERQEKVKKIIESMGFVTHPLVKAAFGISQYAASSMIYDLVRMNVIVRERHGRYVLPRTSP